MSENPQDDHNIEDHAHIEEICPLECIHAIELMIATAIASIIYFTYGK